MPESERKDTSSVAYRGQENLAVERSPYLTRQQARQVTANAGCSKDTPLSSDEDDDGSYASANLALLRVRAEIDQDATSIQPRRMSQQRVGRSRLVARCNRNHRSTAYKHVFWAFLRG